MAYTFPEGGKFLFSETFASAKIVSAIANANPALATSTAHGFVDGNEVLLTSGWEDAGDTVYTIDQMSADTFLLNDLDTGDTRWFNPGAGAGTAQLVSNWVEIPQVLTIATSGGDPRFTEVNPLARRNGLKIPTGFNATDITLTLGHDAAHPNYKQMLGVSRALRKVAFKMALSGSVSYGYGYLAVSEMPSLNNNSANTVTASFSLLGRSISYAT